MRIGRVYKIIHNQSNLTYIGSTFQELRYRFRDHKGDFKKWLNGKHMAISIYPYFKEFGIENFKMILIKEYEVCDRKHLEVYEQLWINKLSPCNKQNSFGIKKISAKFYRFNNKEKIKERKKKHREKNKQYYKDYDKEYYKINKEKIKNYNKIHYERNKEKIIDNSKKYYEKNAEKVRKRIQNYNKQKIHCEVCDCMMRRDSYRKHEKTKKHQNNLS